MKYSREDLIPGFQFKTETGGQYRVVVLRGEQAELTYDPDFRYSIYHPILSILSCLEDGEFVHVNPVNSDTYEIF
jgi:hypothetical protein